MSAFLWHWWLPVVVAVAVIAVWDVVALVRRGVQATISRHVVAIAFRKPIWVVAFIFPLGVLVGHLFWSQPTPGCVCP